MCGSGDLLLLMIVVEFLRSKVYFLITIRRLFYAQGDFLKISVIFRDLGNTFEDRPRQLLIKYQYQALFYQDRGGLSKDHDFLTFSIFQAIFDHILLLKAGTFLIKDQPSLLQKIKIKIRHFLSIAFHFSISPT